MITYLIAIILLAGVGMVVLGWQEAQREAPEAIVSRLARVRARREEMMPQNVQERERERIFAQNQEQAARAGRRTTTLPSLSRFFTKNEILMRLEEDLTQSRSQWRASELVSFSVFLSLLAFILFSYFVSPILALPVAAACLFIPWMYVKVLRQRLYRKFDEQLADTLLLMANSLKAGFSFLKSVDMVAREAQSPICDEFGRINQEIAVGIPVDTALDNLSHRIKSVDVNLMVTAVIIQREVGGSLSEILETISAVIRERVRLKGEIRTLTTQGRATGAILGCLPISLGIILHFVTKAMSPREPSFIEPLFHTAPGQVMLVIATVMQLIGFAIIWKVVSIKV